MWVRRGVLIAEHHADGQSVQHAIRRHREDAITFRSVHHLEGSDQPSFGVLDLRGVAEGLRVVVVTEQLHAALAGPLHSAAGEPPRLPAGPGRLPPWHGQTSDLPPPGIHREGGINRSVIELKLHSVTSAS
jgi:hypothetical protein